MLARSGLAETRLPAENSVSELPRPTEKVRAMRMNTLRTLACHSLGEAWSVRQDLLTRS